MAETRTAAATTTRATTSSHSVCSAQAKEVYAFWNENHQDHTYHMGAPWEGERKLGVAFYAFDRQVMGAEPVYNFWHMEYFDTTFHFGVARPGEEARTLVFYAFPFPRLSASALASLDDSESMKHVISLSFSLAIK